MVLLCECLFKLRIKEETFNGEQRVKCCIVGVEKLDASGINHHLSQELDSILKDVSHPFLKEGSTYTTVHYANLADHANLQQRLTARGYATGIGVTGYGMLNRMPTAVSASSNGFVSSDGFTGLSSLSAGRGSSSLCFRCNQPGHWAKDCFVQAT